MAEPFHHFGYHDCIKNFVIDSIGDEPTTRKLWFKCKAASHISSSFSVLSLRSRQI
jgi:hypothetical protein